MYKIFSNIFLIFLVSLFFMDTAFAYLDAGTGSIVMQALIGAVVGLFFVVKLFWQKIKTFFVRFFKKN